MQLDYENKRHIPKGCPTDDVFFNLYIDDEDPVAVSSQTTYAAVVLDLKAGEKHNLEVYNWADKTVTSHYILSTFSEDAETPILDK